MMMKPFTIASFAWKQDNARRLAAAGDEFDSEEVILRKLSTLAKFLDREQLTTRPLTDTTGRVGQNFVLQSNDLTEVGLQLIRMAYEKWHRQTKTPEDMSPLEKALAKIRAGEAEGRTETSPTRSTGKHRK
jgi:hypothetical protein